MLIDVIDETEIPQSKRGRSNGWAGEVREAARKAITKCVRVKVSDIPCDKRQIAARIRGYSKDFKVSVSGEYVYVKYAPLVFKESI